MLSREAGCRNEAHIRLVLWGWIASPESPPSTSRCLWFTCDGSSMLRGKLHISLTAYTELWAQETGLLRQLRADRSLRRFHDSCRHRRASPLMNRPVAKCTVFLAVIHSPHPLRTTVLASHARQPFGRYGKRALPLLGLERLAAHVFRPEKPAQPLALSDRWISHASACHSQDLGTVESV